jgi:hypothetical protein
MNPPTSGFAGASAHLCKVLARYVFALGHIMKKMGTRSLADLVRITGILGIRRAKP